MMYLGLGRSLDPVKAAIWRRRHVGPRTHIDPTVHVMGWRNVRIGSDCVISEHSWININNRRSKSIALEIGDHSYIGRRNFFSSGKRIRLGPFALTGLECRYMGSDHLFGDPMVPYGATGTSLDNVIDIGANCWLGAGVTVLGNVTIGHGSIIGAGSLVLKDIPSFSIALGSPARVVKRFDIERKQWISLDEYSTEMAGRLPDEERYTAILRAAKPFFRIGRGASGKARGDLP